MAIVEDNKSALTSAAYMEAGRIANNQVAKLVSSKLPLVVRAYATTPIGKLIIANTAQIAVERFKPDSVKAQTLVKAMMVQAYQEVIQTIDIEALLESVMEDSKISKALDKISVEG